MGSLCVWRSDRPLPELTNPARAAQILNGYQAISQEGELITGTSSAIVLPSLSKPAGASQILYGYQAINQKGKLITGTSPAKVLPSLSDPATAEDIVSGKQAITASGGVLTGNRGNIQAFLTGRFVVPVGEQRTFDTGCIDATTLLIYGSVTNTGYICAVVGDKVVNPHNASYTFSSFGFEISMNSAGQITFESIERNYPLTFDLALVLS